MPTRDGGSRFRRCLQALATQEPPIDALVVVDSGSRDGTADAARAAGATLLDPGPGGYDHGLTRNRGAAALPELQVVVFLVQDAVPQGPACLEVLARAALEPGVAAATARQVPPADISPLSRATVERSPFAAAARQRTGPFAAEAWAAFTPGQWRSVVRLDSVACAVRGELFRRCGFPQADFGEDALLAADLLRSGWSLLHEPEAVVEHGHDYEPRVAAARYEQDATFFRRRFGLRLRAGRLDVLKGWLAQMRADHRWVSGQPGLRTPALFLRAAALRWAMVAAQARGSRGPLGSLPRPRALPGPAELAS